MPKYSVSIRNVILGVGMTGPEFIFELCGHTFPKKNINTLYLEKTHRWLPPQPLINEWIIISVIRGL